MSLGQRFVAFTLRLHLTFVTLSAENREMGGKIQANRFLLWPVN